LLGPDRLEPRVQALEGDGASGVARVALGRSRAAAFRARAKFRGPATAAADLRMAELGQQVVGCMLTHRPAGCP
ncbi:MAG TPA: hypothetical protein VF400_03635, partial [Anaeromyxobacteraceae bacterium]